MALNPYRNVAVSPFDGQLDPTTDTGRKLYELATKALPQLFDGKAENYMLFIQSVQQRVRFCRWERILPCSNDRGHLRNILTQHGQLTLANVVDERDRFRNIRVPTQRDEQDFMKRHWLFDFLNASLHPDFKKNKLIVKYWDIDYDGPTLLMSILTSSYQGTRVQIFSIKEQLNGLSLRKFGMDVHRMHAMVRENILKLHAAGSEHQDIILSLFRAYRQAPNAEFRATMAQERNRITRDNEDLDMEDLMLLAETKAQELIDEHQWTRRDPRDDKLVGLATRVDTIEALVTTEQSEDKTPQSKKLKPSQQWKSKPPSDGESHTKVVKGQTYHWCPYHKHREHPDGLWVPHTLDQCKAKKRADAKNGATNPEAMSVEEEGLDEDAPTELEPQLELQANFASLDHFHDEEAQDS